MRPACAAVRQRSGKDEVWTVPADLTRISHKQSLRSYNPYLVKVKRSKGSNSVLFFSPRFDRGQSLTA